MPWPWEPRRFEFIAEKGMDAFLTEYQNDPPAEKGPVESGITAHRIQRQLNGLERKIVPTGIWPSSIALPGLVSTFSPATT